MIEKKKNIKINTKAEKPPIETKTPQRDDDPDKEEQAAAGDSVEAMEARIASLEQEVKETLDRLLRVSAEFENYKKRAAREMNEFKKFANESFAKSMLPVVDNLDRAIASSSNDEYANRSVVEGVNMTLKEILKVFDQFGIKPFESLGEPFNPGFHQAMMQEETADHPENTVLNELQKGYMIHDRLLRPAMVVVSKAKETSNSEDKENQN